MTIIAEGLCFIAVGVVLIVLLVKIIGMLNGDE